MLTLHQFHESGNCYKIRLCAHQLEVPLQLVDVDVMHGETRKPAFLAKNPNGRTPTLELEDGKTLPESNAILLYLAEGTHLVPKDRWSRASTYQWMFFEQYSHEPYIAVARFWCVFASKEKLDEKRHLIPEWKAKGNAALGVMDTHLAKHEWFAGEDYSVADIALYAYTHCAGDGGFDLKQFPHVSRWLEQVRLRPRHIPMSYRW